MNSGKAKDNFFHCWKLSRYGCFFLLSLLAGDKLVNRKLWTGVEGGYWKLKGFSGSCEVLRLNLRPFKSCVSLNFEFSDPNPRFGIFQLKNARRHKLFSLLQAFLNVKKPLKSSFWLEWRNLYSNHSKLDDGKRQTTILKRILLCF